MSRLPAISPGLTIKFLMGMGFEKSRQHGSHIFFAILMAAPPQSHSIKGKIWAAV